MAITWANMTFLTAAQRAAAQQLFDLGQTLKGPDDGAGSGIVPPLTMSNTKRAAEMMRDFDDLLGPTARGIRYSLIYYRQQALQELESTNP